MLFNSYIFILLFLPLCLTVYFTLNHFSRFTAAQFFLFCMSLWFYGFFNPSYLPIILISIAANYTFVWIMDKVESDRARKITLAVAMLLNVGILFYFKYFDFFLENVNALFRTNFPLLSIPLPLGISFFTFQQISYIVDAYRGEIAGKYNFLQYASFVVYFPQLIAGPIVTHDELIPQLEDLSRKKFNWENFAPGIFLFVLGLAKKVLIADTFGAAANWGFSNLSGLDSTNAILSTLAYTFQVYFDFSGYCDMAVGIGRMMNIDLPVNFDSPYKSLTITEFWHRWHKTLTRFFTKYIYIPLGGNRRGKLQTYINIMTVFLISGLWHGANWTFVLWGGMHGLLMVVTRHWKSWIDRIPSVLCWVITFVFLNATWIFFRADSIGEGIDLLKRILIMDFAPIDSNIINAFLLPEVNFLLSWLVPVDVAVLTRYVLVAAAYAGALALVLCGRNAYEYMCSFQPSFWNLLRIIILFVWCVVSFSGESTFLYFNF